MENAGSYFGAVLALIRVEGGEPHPRKTSNSIWGERRFSKGTGKDFARTLKRKIILNAKRKAQAFSQCSH